MGVALATLFVSGLLSLVIGALVWFLLLRRIQKSCARVLLLLVVIAASGLGLLAPVGSFLWSQTVRQGTRVPLDSYRGIGPRLPSSVPHVTYHSSYSGTEAVFPVEENDLAQWARSHDWTVVEIEHPERVDFERLNISASVTNGIIVSETWHPRGTGVRIVFNRQTGDCFFRFAAY